MNTFTCTCCRLDHPHAQLRVAAFLDQTPQTLCPLCEMHQGDSLARAESHEAQLRFRLNQAERLTAAARVAEEAAQRALTTIERTVDLHHGRPDGTCSCGQRECATRVVLSDPWLTGRIPAHEPREQSA